MVLGNFIRLASVVFGAIVLCSVAFAAPQEAGDVSSKDLVAKKAKAGAKA
jgi:hypothetical protein